MSRGPTDGRGNRTEISNHSFGAAVDLNEENNGLYEKCFAWSKKCALRKGGRYRPGEDPLSLREESPAVVELKKAGFLWGGRIAGNQKDFMHFSPTGY
ncbi:MAG: M15 family metallopeptidase [Elusimicrobia bacterium]|nr:M15 family metallopeptidase [Elusimicrobiota bacterium]